VAQNDQFALLMLFVNELGMSLENEDQRYSSIHKRTNVLAALLIYHSFLIGCANWIGEGRHLNLLDAILQAGFEPSGTDSPLFQKWPNSCSPNWISEELTPDPFFLEYLTILVKASPGECESNSVSGASNDR
jgi:hypothetical protein